MKKFAFLLCLTLTFAQCSSEPSGPKPDIEYNFDGVRILIPRGYQKVSSEEEIRKIATDQDQDNVDDFLLKKMLTLNGSDEHWFVKFDGKHFNYLNLKTNGPPLRLNAESASYLQIQFEKILEENFSQNDSTYYFRNMQSKLSSANTVKYLKLKYFHHQDGKDWYNTNYLIYSNNRTIGMSLITPHKDHLDLEKHMNFIKIK